MFATIEEATEYACTFVHRMDPEVELDTDVVARTIEVFMLDTMEGEIPPAVKAQIIAHRDDPIFLESYIAQVIPNYYTAMEAAVTRFITPYFIVEQEVTV